MINFEKYESKGERTLSSGKKSNLFYDFKLLKKPMFIKDLQIIVDKIRDIKEDLKLVGIYTMGAYIAKKVDKNCIIYFPNINKLSEKVKKDYLLFDDVGTTFSTIRKAILKIERIPKTIVVIVNRKDVNLGIESVYGVKIIELRNLLSEVKKI